MMLRSLFTENIGLKALSLLFAVVLWLFVALNVKDELEIPLQVNFMNLPQGLTLKEPVCRRLTLRMAGKRLLLLKQQSKGVSLSLDLAGLAAGKASFSSLERHLNLQEGVTPLWVSPANMDLVLIPVGKTE